MESISALRVLQVAAGFVLIAEYVRRLIFRKTAADPWQRYRRFWLLASGIVLLALGVWGKLPILR